jgi:hypothetical protein
MSVDRSDCDPLGDGEERLMSELERSES